MDIPKRCAPTRPCSACVQIQLQSLVRSTALSSAFEYVPWLLVLTSTSIPDARDANARTCVTSSSSSSSSISYHGNRNAFTDGARRRPRMQDASKLARRRVMVTTHVSNCAAGAGTPDEEASHAWTWMQDEGRADESEQEEDSTFASRTCTCRWVFCGVRGATAAPGSTTNSAKASWCREMQCLWNEMQSQVLHGCNCTIVWHGPLPLHGRCAAARTMADTCARVRGR